MVPKIHIFLWKEGPPPCNHQKLYISVNLDQKGPRASDCAYLARKIQNFLGQGDAVPLELPKSYICFTENGLKLCIYGSQNTHSHMKRRAAPLQPPEIIYFCKFRPKRASNCAYLAKLCIYGSKNTHFLMKRRATPL